MELRIYRLVKQKAEPAPGRERERERYDVEVFEVMNITKVNSECLFIVSTFQELEVPFTWLFYIIVSYRT